METKASRARRLLRSKTRLLEQRYQALAHYSGGTPKCKCCGDTHWEYLTLDHTNDDGASLRRKYPIAGSSNLYRWLAKMNYPTGIEVKCFNCNSGRWVNGGTCPHVGTETIPKPSKLKTLAHYSGGAPKCQCCGEKTLSFLCIDHVNESGCKHRQKTRYARSIHKFLISKGFPPGYRVLCFNCNFATKVYGKCIHKLKETSPQRLKRILARGCLIKGGPKPKPIKDRFLSKVQKTKTCWLWKGAKFWDGYGVFARGRAHKKSYEIFVGRIPEGMLVLHKCDTHECVRPSHLFLGTNRQKTNLQLKRGYLSRHKRKNGNRVYQYKRGCDVNSQNGDHEKAA